MKVPRSWRVFLGPILVREMEEAAEKAYQKSSTLPAAPLVFQAFREVAPEDVRVVILGQDPYHTEGKPRGVAFGYHPGYRGKLNSSLKNIIQTIPGAQAETFDVTLSHWTEQGVLLLNTALTVQPEKPRSDFKIWQPVMKKLLTRLKELPNITWILWGEEAQEIIGLVPSSHGLVASSHPSRYSATRGRMPFMNSHWTTRTDAAMQARGFRRIKWR